MPVPAAASSRARTCLPWIAALGMALFLGACAANTSRRYSSAPASGRSELRDGESAVRISVDTIPSGGIIRVDGIRQGTAPLYLSLPVQDGSFEHDYTIGADFTTNVFAGRSREPHNEKGETVLATGDPVPGRILFQLNVSQTGIPSVAAQVSGRALPPIPQRKD